MILRGGFFDGKEIADITAPVVSLPVVEQCGDHFSNWEYDHGGTFIRAYTWVGDIVYPERFPRGGAL